MKTVCIVGAGPAGLASAKVLLQTGQFEVKIFEQADRIGGIWNIDQRSPSNGFLHPHTPTNLSRFTVAFSDLDWHSVGLENVPMFPKAWQVSRYLEVYAKKNLPSSVFDFESKVVETEATENRWKVAVQDRTGRQVVYSFDHLLLGSGFFSKPRPIHRDVPNVAADLGIKAIHSSQFRSLNDLFADPADATGKTILLIGGGNSAGEAAAAVAQQLSDAWYSPITGKHQPYKDCKIFHVTPRPLYALPPYNPVDEKYQTYVPLDLKLYDLAKRPAGPITANAGQLTPAVKDMIHGALQSQIGGNQSDLRSSGLQIPDQEPRSAVHVALSESYSEFVRSRLIDARPGRVTAIQPSSAGCSAIVENSSDGTKEELTNIGAIIYATGYSPSTAISFLPEDVKQKLHHDSDSARLPLILSGWQTMSPEVPNLALIGFYEGPYWGIIEMQARFTAKRWLSGTSPPPINQYEHPEQLFELRRAMKERNLFVPQYWFGDYAGYMEELASITNLNIIRNDAPFQSGREGPVLPARYLLTGDDQVQASATMKDLHQTWTDCTTKGRFMPRAAFRALQGNWKIHRNIDSKLSTFPSGILNGEAAFHPRCPTSDRSGQKFDLEYLYIESGTLTLSNGANMTARRRYIYRYSEAQDELSVWFVKLDKELEVDYLFHNLVFAPPVEAKPGIVAKADHLCVEDMYWTEYRLPLKGNALHNFTTEHKVKGPEKDYTATTEYRRP